LIFHLRLILLSHHKCVETCEINQHILDGFCQVGLFLHSEIHKDDTNKARHKAHAYTNTTWMWTPCCSANENVSISNNKQPYNRYC